ncbi:NAD(P)H-hydrate dehydratase [Acidovorax kalamii]|uniref:Bifunctional NAD(P)H-hydrate repair enzyme n=1 Tax=Acidovorax kalamii TaxID=2004485 RepID=A0A235ERD6_9BURK|nr:NAD(P)H-hydrate dehydratase [Acidovorax kalamii]OYD51581.1 bifunctional ADP-dependent NAD(P)H-hydrate dehydratase/NAD(P)H-hydrate epimerase [Acidovorax kalamii]
MHRITPHQPHPLFHTAATRRIEQAAAAPLPPHTLMQRAGLAVAQLAQALAPHARTVWIACGPGNNGGDGLEAAMHLQRSGRQVVVTWLGQPDKAPADAKASWQRALAAGVAWADTPPADLGPQDLCIDALLGIGVSSSPHAPIRVPDARLRACQHALQHSPAPVLAVDLPSGLDADTGQFAAGFAPQAAPHHHPHITHIPGPARHTLSLLTLKPGLFTAAGRDAAGQVWWDDLGAHPGHEAPTAWLCGPPLPAPRAHASHKGSFGDVAVVGGEGLATRGLGMAGAALLAASAALHSGAGRVLVALLDNGHQQLDTQQPELMFRRFDALALGQLTMVCGCGGGQAIAAVLPEVIPRAARLVLDADALNTIATEAALHALVVARGQHGQPTVITPHPLEAARLLGLTTAEVQADRLDAAQQLADQFNCVAVLKGSGTVIAAPGRVPAINPTGNARLATAGTGDVLAGMVGAHLAAGASALRAASEAVYQHGQAADAWPAGQALTASALARRVGG